jgi:hypothetical protein
MAGARLARTISQSCLGLASSASNPMDFSAINHASTEMDRPFVLHLHTTSATTRAASRHRLLSILQIRTHCTTRLLTTAYQQQTAIDSGHPAAQIDTAQGEVISLRRTIGQ